MAESWAQSSKLKQTVFVLLSFVKSPAQTFYLIISTFLSQKIMTFLSHNDFSLGKSFLLGKQASINNNVQLHIHFILLIE